MLSTLEKKFKPHNVLENREYTLYLDFYELDCSKKTCLYYSFWFLPTHWWIQGYGGCNPNPFWLKFPPLLNFKKIEKCNETRQNRRKQKREKPIYNLSRFNICVIIEWINNKFTSPLPFPLPLSTQPLFEKKSDPHLLPV